MRDSLILSLASPAWVHVLSNFLSTAEKLILELISLCSHFLRGQLGEASTISTICPEIILDFHAH